MRNLLAKYLTGGKVGFARLASGSFYETIVYGIFNDSKTQDSGACPGPDPGFAE
jgi:hypothetical protein